MGDQRAVQVAGLRTSNALSIHTFQHWLKIHPFCNTLPADEPTEWNSHSPRMQAKQRSKVKVQKYLQQTDVLHVSNAGGNRAQGATELVLRCCRETVWQSGLLSEQ